MRMKDLIFLTEACNDLIANNKKFWPKYFTFHKPNSNSVNKHCDFPSFGSTIDKCIKCPVHKLVPAVVSGCIQEVEERGLHVTGLYRLSGNEKAIHSLINEIDKEPRGVDYKAPPWTDIHNTCAALKQFFRRLAEPLVPSSLYPAFMEAAQLEDHDSRHETLKNLVTQLPECHHATAKLLFRHLAKVAAHAEDNKMHTYNLAIIFGPTVIRSQNSDMVSLVADMSNQYKVVECLITKFSYIFDEEQVAADTTPAATTHPVDTTADTRTSPSQLDAPLIPETESDSRSPDSSDTNQMGLFGGKKHKPALNGLTTPTDERTSLPTGWEFGHVIDRARHVEKCDKSTQVNIPKSPQPPVGKEDRIVYKKEPVGIVHPYKDDIKMRPISRILDKKLVTLDKKRGDEDRRSEDRRSEDRRSEPDEERALIEPMKSLSLESLLDAIQTDQHRQPARNMQHEPVQQFCSHQRNGGFRYRDSHLRPSVARDEDLPRPCPSFRGATSTDTASRMLPSRPAYHHQDPAAPYRKASLPEEHLASRDPRDMTRAPRDMTREHNRADSRPHPSPSQRNYIPNNSALYHNPSHRQSDRQHSRSHHSAERFYHPSGRSQYPPERSPDQRSRGKDEPWWMDNMLHSQQGSHPSLSHSHAVTQRVTSPRDQISRTNEQRGEDERRHSESEARPGRRQPGHTHKWVLDNNTTLLESTL